MPPYDPRAFMKLMFYSIGFLLVCTYLFANEVTTKDKVIGLISLSDSIKTESKGAIEKLQC